MLTGAGRGERGFTLVELMVAMLSGIVIILATFAIIDLTLRDNSRVTDRTQATNTARSFMEQTVAELQSGCLVPDVSPLQPVTPTGITPSVTTDATHLVFVSGMGDSATNTPTLHVLSYAGGALTDTSYANTGGIGPTLTAASGWTFSATATSARTLANAPAFSLSYYSYPNSSGSLNGASPVTLPLATTWPAGSGEVNHAFQIARVDIALTVGPDGGDSQWGSGSASVRVGLTNSVVFRLTPPSPGTANFPCD